MAQTKRKRRTKHRGNAAGMIEARGRTGRKPEPSETKPARGAAGQRHAKPATWKGAAGKAAFGAVMLFVLVQLGVLGGDLTTSGALLLCAAAMVFYTPVMYATDNFFYRRRMRQEQGGR